MKAEDVERIHEASLQILDEVELAARNGTTTVLDPESEAVFWTTPVLYLWTGAERRPVTSADLLAIARLSDRLDAVQGVMACGRPPRARASTRGCCASRRGGWRRSSG